MLVEEFSIDDIDVKIWINSKGFMLAQASVTYFGLVQVHGYRVMQSKHEEDIFVDPPRIPVTCKPSVYITNPVIWKDVVEKIKMSYWQVVDQNKANDQKQTDELTDKDYEEIEKMQRKK
ncbi:hypothetical protein JW710_03815 [Candidatus Dojkabacteria bacterium]|nr:hypothetical protein [Candidatus Dojkabacteria bacterium]